VSFEKASYVFTDKNSLTIFDDEHSDYEDRWITLGKIKDNSLLVVVYTERVKNNLQIMRIISARKANKIEIEVYYKQINESMI
jgi:hypothetical protein